MRNGWRLASVVAEGLANLTCSTWRLILLAVALGGMFGALIWIELSFSDGVKEQEGLFAEAGGYVVVVGAPAGLDAASCEALRWEPHVIGAGGVRGGVDVYAANSPGNSFSQLQVTGDIARVWDPNYAGDARPGYLIGQAAANELGLANATWLKLVGEPTAPVTVIDAQRNDFAARAIMEAIAPTGLVDQCWVEFPPQYVEAGRRWLVAYFAADEADTRIVVSRGEFGIDPLEAIATRPQRFGWLPVAAVGAVLLTLTALFRRSETAVYRSFGLSLPGLLIMHQIETIVLVALAFGVSSVWAIAAYSLTAAPPGLDQVWLALRTAGMAAALVAILGPVGSLLAGTGSPAALLKER